MSNRGNRTERTAYGFVPAGAKAPMHPLGSTGAPSAEVVRGVLNGNMQYHYEPGEKLAAVLKDNPSFMALAKTMRVGNDPVLAVEHLITRWVVNSASAESGALQLAARDVFNLQTAAAPKSNALATDLYAAHGEAFRAFLQAQYQVTQDYFASHGITSLSLYRGMTVPSPASIPGVQWSRGGTGTAPIATRPLSSFSYNAPYAENFSGVGQHPYEIVMKADVPVSRIIGTGVTGLGSTHEYEAVVLGGVDDYSYETDIRNGYS